MGVVSGPTTPLEQIASQVTKIGLIVSAVIGFNTAVTGCVETSESRFKHFEAAVHDEESFYKGLYGEYVTSLDLKENDERRKARILSIKTMASRPLPRFDVYYLGPFSDDRALKVTAAQHIAAMQQTLLSLIADKDTSGAAVADAAQLQTFQADDGANLRTREGATVVPAVAARTDNAVDASKLSIAITAAGTVNYKAKVLTAGSPTGYDIDVFWCTGQEEGANASLAQRVADYLVAKADTGVPVASGVRLGRIRLRPLPEAVQGSRGYQDRGYRIVNDNTPGDLQAAQAIKGALETTFPGLFQPGTSDIPSKWYVSVFVCPPPKPAAATISRTERTITPAA